MAYDYKFGPAAQTSAQRAGVLAKMQDAIPSLKTRVPAYAHALYAQYVAGELSWVQMRQAVDAAATLS